MKEEPKNIWKKPLKMPGLFLLWLILLVATTLIFSAILSVIGEPFHSLSDLLKTFIASLFIATAMFCLWLFIRWIFQWRNFKRFLFGFACFVTLIALFYAEEDWRGKHDWEKFKREQETNGEKFDWQSVVPPAVPDGENFAFSPVWIAEIRYVFWGTGKSTNWYGDRIYSQEVSNLSSLFPISVSTVVGTNMWKFPQPPENSGTWASGDIFDLKLWQYYYHNLGKTNPAAEIIVAPKPQSPAQDVLLALSKFDTVIEQLRQDSLLPYSRFPLQYNYGMPAAILLPHLAAEKSIAQVLQLRAAAELQNGESEKALADVKLMFRLIDASRTEPFLICHLVRLAILNLTLQPVWEGLAEQKWSDGQLTDLDLELAKLDFLADCKYSMRGERGLEIANIEFLRNPTQELQFKRPRLYFLAPMLSLVQMLANMSSDDGDAMNIPRTLALGMGPSGWLEQNKLKIAQFDTTWYSPIADENANTISPTKSRAADDALNQEKQHPTLENVFVSLFIPSWRNASEKFAYAQASVDMARVAIALERYRLAHGEFPESLDVLAPKFIAELPHDVIGGGPLHYRRTNDGQFVLYSIGWNETDDGGVVVFKKGSQPRDENKTGVDMDQGDWVWRYPPKAE